jgi:hypothetical protein
VAIALVGLLAFTALVVDYGVLWVARRQVQNAADAGALAGAISLAFGPPVANREDLSDPAYAAARAAAASVARSNLVWGAAPRVIEATDVIIIECPDPDLPDKCVRVNAYRNQEGGSGNSPLPTFFARLVGVENQGVRATATAEIISGNFVPYCIKPFALPDQWLDGADQHPSRLGETYNPYDPPDSYDTYVRGADGCGWHFPEDYGVTVVLHSDQHSRPTSSWAQLIEVAGHGTMETREAIRGCEDVSLSISPGWADTISLKQGQSAGLKHGVADLLEDYPDTRWNHATNTWECGSDPCPNHRFGVVPVYDATTVEHPAQEAAIIGFVGIFIEGMGDDPEVQAHHQDFVDLMNSTTPKGQPQKYVIAHIIPAAGLRTGDAGAPQDSSFLRTVVLVR